jgi:hypothetical protein
MEDVKDILQTIIKKMELVETFTKLNGDEKKLRVMASLKCFMSNKDLERYTPFLSGFIDVICDIARGSDSIHINDVKKCFLSCIK